jgi:DNA invertase Pin-like site-specific DNA recombinase
MSIVHSYLRFSTAEQRKGDSSRRQIADRDEYIRDGKHTLSNLNLKDLGVSAFRGKNATKGDLAKFLALIEDGTVRPGEQLAVESLDRLSRNQVTDALSLFLQIITAGVPVYTTMDKKFYSVETINKNPMDLMASILIMVRAHEESETKSRRVSAAWEQKRERATQKKTPMTAKCPGWIRLDPESNQFELIPDRVAIVRQMIAMTLDGRGCYAITFKFNKSKVATWSREGFANTWDVTTVRCMLESRALVGEFQPCIMKDGIPTPTGEPIAGYYPSIIDEPTWYQMQAAINVRKGTGVGPHGNEGNLFPGILYTDNGTSKAMMRYKDVHGTLHAYFVGQNLKKGIGKAISIMVTPFERAFLRWIQEVDLDVIQPKPKPADLHDKLSLLQTIKDRIQKLNDMIVSGGGELDTLATALTGLSQRRKELIQEIDAQKADGHKTAVSKMDFEQLMVEMDSLDHERRIDARRRLKTAIRNVVQRIDLYVRGERLTKIAVAHVTLSSGAEKWFALRTNRDDAPFTVFDLSFVPEKNKDTQIEAMARRVETLFSQVAVTTGHKGARRKTA